MSAKTRRIESPAVLRRALELAAFKVAYSPCSYCGELQPNQWSYQRWYNYFLAQAKREGKKEE